MLSDLKSAIELEDVVYNEKSQETSVPMLDFAKIT